MKRLLAAAVLAFSLIGPSTSRGQVSIGGQLDYGDETDFGIGGRLELGLLTDMPIRLVGSFDYFFPELDGLDYWEANANLIFTYPLPGSSWLPYFGGGLNVARFDLESEFTSISRSETDLGGNVLVGFKHVAGPIVPFGELRLEIAGGEQFVLTGGILFILGSGL